MWEAAGGGGLAHNEPQPRSQRGRLHNRQAKQAGGGESLKRPCAHSLRQLPGLCGKMDPPARRRVGSPCLTRPLLRVRLFPGRQEGQRPDRPVSSSPTHIPSATEGLAEDRGTPACREWYRQNSPEPSLARPARHREAARPAGSGPRSRLFPTLCRDLILPFSIRASRTAFPQAEAS